MVGANADWERHHDGAYISIPINARDLHEVWAWCNENCEGDFLVVLGPWVIFQRQEDAALTTLWWRAEER